MAKNEPRVVKGRGKSPDGKKLTYHGSPHKRDMLKHGGQAGRWEYLHDLLGRTRDDSAGPAPRWF
jgi:hypothetical protein